VRRTLASLQLEAAGSARSASCSVPAIQPRSRLRLISQPKTFHLDFHLGALALPRIVMARPEGFGRALATYEIPIEGRDEWLAAARRLA
jgi:hypothetical protein